MARTIAGTFFVVVFLAGVARGEGTPDGGVVVAPEDAFFQGAAIVAQHHFSGPASPRADVWIRTDGHVLLRRLSTLLDGLDAGSTDGVMWRESQIDVALVKKIERTVARAGSARRRARRASPSVARGSSSSTSARACAASTAVGRTSRSNARSSHS